MATKNDITGDTIKTKINTDKYRENWDTIFGKKKINQILEDIPQEDNTLVVSNIDLNDSVR